MDQRLSTRLAAESFELQYAQFEQRLDESVDRWRTAGDRLRHFGRKWILEGYMARDVDVLVSMVTDDFTQDDPINFGRIVHGPDEFRRVMDDTFRAFPDTTFTVDGGLFLGTDPGTFVLPWHGFGTFSGPLEWGAPGSRRHLAPTDRRFDFTGVDIYTLRGDRVSSMRSLYDPIEVCRQLGLMPPTDNLVMRLAPWPQALIARAQRAFSR